jgi:hypothetical protein
LPPVRTSVASGVVDDQRDRVEVQELGVGAAPHTRVQGVDRRDLVGLQREVEDVEVLGDALA